MIRALGIHEIESDLRVGYYRDSFFRFFRDAWHVLEQSKPLVVNWHMEYLCGELEIILHRVKNMEPREHDLIINVPPASTKSTIITITFPVWCWIHEPSLRILSMSHDASLANTHATRSRDLINSEWYQNLFGHLFQLKIDENRISEYATDKGGMRVAFGVGRAPTGKHGDIIICDDPIDPIKVISDEQTKKVNKWWDRSVINRMTDADVSTKIIVMQRLSKQDLTGHCLKNNPEAYRHICLPATDSPKVKPFALRKEYRKRDGLLSPKRLSRSALEKFRKGMGSIGYAGQYDQNPIAEGGNLIKEGWVKEFTMEQLAIRANDFDTRIVWNFFIDGAYTQDVLNAPTAILVAAGVGGWCFVRHAERQWMELPELIKHIPKVCKEHGYCEQSYIYVEPKASGLSIIQMLERYTTLNVLADKPPREGKVERTKGNLPFIEAGHLQVLKGGQWVTMYLGELEAFPFSEYMDLTDVTNMAIDRVDKGGVGGGEILDIGSL